MTRFFIYVTAIIALQLNTFTSFAQGKKGGCDFVPYERTLFKDDFIKDQPGTFPGQWDGPPNTRNRSNQWLVKIMEHPDGNYLSVSTALSNKGTISLEPKMTELNYLPDSFTVEFDVNLETKEAQIDVDFYASSKEEIFKLIFHAIIKKEKKGFFLEYTKWYTHYLKSHIKLPTGFICNDWHHVAISYAHKNLKYCLDEEGLLVIPGHDHLLSGLLFSFSGSVALKNVRLAAGYKDGARPHIDNIPVVPVRQTAPVPIPPLTDNPLDKILTENKFITHALNFDVNKSTIEPESMEFIWQLAEFMRANPSVNLEIHGHTDSDGDAAFNIKLSQARAEEVKRQLEENGIESDRLIAKGYGATMPIQPNTSPEGKAENRRVEFIRQ